jgi:hypothetical protein
MLLRVILSLSHLGHRGDYYVLITIISSNRHRSHPFPLISDGSSTDGGAKKLHDGNKEKTEALYLSQGRALANDT